MCEFSKSDFTKPDKKHSVFYSWVWNAPVTYEESEKQLLEFSRAGVRAIYILPEPKEFRPTSSKTFLEPDYLTDEFMKCVRHAILYAKSLGMAVWLYDEGGWPSGGACTLTLKNNSNAVCKALQAEKSVLSKGEVYSPLQNEIAAFCRGTKVESGFSADDDVEITRYSQRRFVNNANFVDLSDESVTDTFISLTYEKYKEYLGEDFGKDIAAFFTDEPRLVDKAWPDNFEKTFFEKYGYDIIDFLPAIMDGESANSSDEKQARIDYGKLIGDCFLKNYFRKLGHWCSENSIALVGHLDVDHIADGGVSRGYYSSLEMLREFDMPGVDVIWNQIKMPKSGSDKAVAEGLSFFPRLASSAARQAGRKYALSESFAVYGDALTFDEQRYVINYQSVRGINVFNFMVASYGKTGALPFVERPTICSEKPGFYHIGHFNDYVARLSYLMNLGEADVSCALYIPNNDIWAGGESAKNVIESYAEIGEKLEKNNICFDLIDDNAILRSEKTADGLKIGKVVYSCIVVPKCEYIPKLVSEKIEGLK